MKISVAIYLILAALAVGGVFVKTRRNKIGLYSVGAALLIFMAAFRDFSVGPDTQQVSWEKRIFRNCNVAPESLGIL